MQTVSCAFKRLEEYTVVCNNLFIIVMGISTVIEANYGLFLIVNGFFFDDFVFSGGSTAIGMCM